MKNHLISYDLHVVRNYTALIKLLTEAGATRVHKSVWFLRTPADASVVRNSLLTTMDKDDSLLVVEMQPGSDWATRLVPPAASNWLHSNVTARSTATA